jgi:glyoxylase-like metal-dependent hydrolase (beta-lactamase superfamily II)
MPDEPDFQIAIVPVTPFQQNCALLWNRETKEAIVVDPGGDAPRILAAVAERGLTVVAMLLTHGHLDHAGAAQDMREALGVPLIGPDIADRFLLDGIEESGAKFGIPGLRNVTPDRWLTDGETLEIAGFRFLVRHCPGHSPGSVIFAEQQRRFAFVGDVIFRNSVGRTDFPYGDGAALIAAIHEKLLPLGDDMFFVCGHGEASSLGAERASNPFLRGAA